MEIMPRWKSELHNPSWYFCSRPGSNFKFQFSNEVCGNLAAAEDILALVVLSKVTKPTASPHLQNILIYFIEVFIAHP